MDTARSWLFLSPLLVALVAPGCAVFARLRLRVVLAVAFVPLALVLVATLVSAPTAWGRASVDDDLTNNGGLVYLVGFTLVFTLVGLVVAALTAGVVRVARRPQP